MAPDPSHPEPPAHEAAARRDWVAYFDRMEGKPARETTKAAITAFERDSGSDASPRFAIDLGCGAGRDTELLLEAGWRVLATDAHPDGLRRLRLRPACVRAEAQGTLSVREESFEEANLPAVDLVNASFALPFCPPAEFPSLWAKIDASISSGGRFAGQFFGDRDDWSILEDRTHLPRAQVLALFGGYVLESFIEEDRPSRFTGEHHKHWHVFHIVARKR
ncbi:MAG: class I SAM-dependent methyltransferase [Planctomycetota bacterium]